MLQLNSELKHASTSPTLEKTKEAILFRLFLSNSSLFPIPLPFSLPACLSLACARVFQVVGGKMTAMGRLGAFITKVKKGSLADVVGHLRAGEWFCEHPNCTVGDELFLFLLTTVLF